MKELEQKLKEMQAELKASFDQAAKERKEHGTALESTTARMAALQKQVDALDAKLAEHHTSNPPGETLADVITKDEGIQRLMHDKSGNATITLKGKHVQQLLERKGLNTDPSILTETGVGYRFQP